MKIENNLKNQLIDEKSFELNRNERSRARDALIQFINNLSISSLDSIRHQIGMLSMVTSQSDGISRESAVLKNN